MTQDSQISTLTSQVNQLLSQAPAGFLPRVYYGLTRGNQTYRFTAEAEISQALTGADGTAFELYSNNETDNDYIPAVAVKQDDSTIKIIIQGDYNYDSSSFTAVNMTTGASETITLSNVLSLQDASSLSDYPAADNKEKQITVIHNVETNSKNVIFASLDLNSDGVYNWIEIGNFVDGTDGKSIYTVNSSNYDTVIANVKVGDSLLAASEFGIFVIGDVFSVDALSPLTLTKRGNIRGAQGVQGPAGQDGQDGSTPVITIVDGNWYVDGVDTGVQAIGTNGTNGQNGQSFQMQSGLYSVPANWGQSGNVDADGNALNQLPTLPTTGITGKGYVVYDPLTTPLAPYYDLYWANDGDNSWTIIHPFSGIAGTDGTDGETPYISGGTWWIGSTNTNVAATGPQGPAGPGVPSGGTAGQVLTKVDGTDYNTEWATPSGGSISVSVAGSTTENAITEQGAYNVYDNVIPNGNNYTHIIYLEETLTPYKKIQLTLTTSNSNAYTTKADIAQALYNNGYNFVNSSCRTVISNTWPVKSTPNYIDYTHILGVYSSDGTTFSIKTRYRRITYSIS